MPHFRIQRNNRGRRVEHDGHKGSLVYRADTVRLSGAACLSRSSVGAVASAVGGHHVGEGIVEAFGFSVYTISERQPILGGIHQNALDGSKRNVKHIVDGPASVGVSS